MKRSKAGFVKWIAIGCLGLLCVALIGGFLAFRGVKRLVSNLTEEYTDTAPVELRQQRVPEHEVRSVSERVQTFSGALERGEAVQPLVLTSRDINALLQSAPNWTNMADRVSVSIEGDRVRARTSLPLEEFGGMFEGRYLNGEAVLRVGMEAGRLLVFVDSITVRGKPLPESFASGLRGQNYAQGINESPDAAPVLQRIASIEVRDGRLIVVPKATPAPVRSQ